MVLVHNFLLTNDHIETWVWKSTEMKFLTFKVMCNFFSLALLFVILQSFIWFSRGYLPNTDISCRPPFHHFLPSFLCCVVFCKWNIHFFILGWTHKNFRFISGHPTDSPLKVKKVWIWQPGGQHLRYLVCHFESQPVYAKNFFWWITKLHS